MNGINNEKDLIPISLFDLKSKSHSCYRHRKFEDVEIVAAKNAAYENAIGMHDILKAVLWDRTATLDDIDDLTAQVTGYDAFDEDDEFDAEAKALKEKTVRKAFHYRRYCKDELGKRRKNLVEFLPTYTVNVGGIYGVTFKPQAVFVKGGNGFPATISAIWYEDKKAGTGISDTKTLEGEVEAFDKKNPEADKHDNARLKLCPMYLRQYILLKYVEELVQNKDFCQRNGLRDDDIVAAEGSCYFMEMKSKDLETSTFFEDGHSNISTLSENYKIGSPNQAPTELDDIFTAYAEAHLRGVAPEKCTADDCKYCGLNASCGFQKAPVQKETIETGKNKAKFEPTKAQQKLLSIGEGNYLCIARAGSGKTAMLVKLFHNLLDSGMKPKEIFMTTFTNNAAAEFMNRLSEEVGGKYSLAKAHISTFHGFALEVVKDNYRELGFTESPKEVNEVDKARIISSLVTKKKISGPKELYQWSYDGVLNVINVAIRLFDAIGEDPEGLTSPDGPEWYYKDCFGERLKGYVESATISELVEIYDEYCKRLREDNIILFSDMELMMHKVLDNHPGYLDRYGFKAIILDEWQDSNDVQMESVRRLKASPSVKLLVAVGDDGQSIYGFRNANIDNILSFGEKLGEKVETINMLENWRSTPEILEFADAFLDLNENKTEGRAVAGRKSFGIKPTINGYHSQESEYSEIVTKMKEYHEAGYDWSNMCFEAPTNAELTKMVEYLAKEGIPYVMRNPMKYSENSRVKAALAFIDNAYYHVDSTAGFFAYLAAKYDGEMLNIKTPEEITDEINKLKETYLYVDDIEEEVQREMLQKYLDELRKDDEIYISFLDEYLYKYRTIEDQLSFIEDFRKFGGRMAKRVDGNYDGVTLITMHSAKGLEWDVCFVTVTSADSLLLQSSKGEEELEEKRRLLYVAMTRARDILHVSGLFFIPGTKTRSKKEGGIVYNQFIKSLYEIAGKAYDPVDHEAEVKAKAAAKAAYEKRKKKLAEQKAS